MNWLKLITLFFSLFIFSFSYSQKKYTPEYIAEELKKAGITYEKSMDLAIKKELILRESNKKKKVRIKEGSQIFYKTNEDSAYNEVILEAILDDTLLVSTYSPELIENEIEVQFAGFKLIPISQIDVLSFSVNHRKGTYWAGFIIYIIGVELVLLTTIMH